MNSTHKIAALRALFQLAIPAADALPPAQRADIYDGISYAAEGNDPDLADIARNVADSLRQSEASQMLFKGILKS